MKFSKLAIACNLFLALSASAIVNVSCSCHTWKDDNTENEYTNYIKDRTFTIVGGEAVGTAWILADQTPTVKTDFNYWICTNMHVVRAMNKSSATKLKYSDYSLAETSGYIKTYKEFSSFSDIKNIDKDTKYLYQDQTQSTYLTSAIDLAIFSVDFGTPTGEIKTKLEKLNKLDNINKFKTINDNSDVHTKGKHIGGYPLAYDGTVQLGAKWECHNYKGDELAYYSINHKFKNNQIGHAIGNPDKDQSGKSITSKEQQEAFYSYDVSPQYVSKQIRPNDYMYKGSSGSLIIDDDYNSIGIYWGGWENDKGEIYPSFSLFNTQYKNFINEFIK